MITRSILAEEFGVWGNISDVIAYFTLPASIIPFWAGRFMARGHVGSAKTGLVTNIIISVITFSLYLALIPLITPVLHISEVYVLLYMIVSLHIIPSYILRVLEAILHIKRPQAIGHGLVAYELSKVMVGYILIIWLNLKLLGAILAVLIAFFMQLAFYLRLVINELKENAKWNYVKEWFKASFFNVYGMIGQRIAALNLILLFVYGGQLARAYYGAALTIAAIIGYSTALAFALYPRLLSGGKAEDALTSLKMVSMLAIPMTAGAIALSDSYLIILNPLYIEAKPILYILALVSICGSASIILETIVYGTEKVDEKAKIPLKALIRSRIFQLATFPYIHSAVALPTLLYILTSTHLSPVESALYLTLIDLTIGIAFLIIRYKIARRCLPFNLPWRALAKYCLATATMATALIIVPHPTRLTHTLAITLLGATTYLATLYLIDKETKDLIKLIMKEARLQLGSYPH